MNPEQQAVIMSLKNFEMYLEKLNNLLKGKLVQLEQHESRVKNKKTNVVAVADAEIK